MDQAVTAAPSLFRGRIRIPVQAIRVVARPLPMEPGVPEIFIRAMEANGVNVHLLQRESRFIRPDGSTSPAWPTYAGSARAALITAGIPEERITAVPAFGEPKSRSWANAHAFALQAHADGITACDIATVGVHARRSRDLFQTACGPGVRVGVIALHDPYCTRGNWWKSYRGWYTLLKEVFGASEVQAVEITQ